MKSFNFGSFFNRQNISLFATFGIALLLIIGASIRYTGFFSGAVFINLIDDSAFLGIAAVGMTFVILSGGIDLSVGSMIGLTSILSAVLIEQQHLNPLIVAILMLLVGAIAGGTMGALIAYGQMAPFLATLAGMFFLRGLAYVISLESIPLTHPVFQWIGEHRIPLGFGRLPLTGGVFLIVVALGIVIAAFTRFGRSCYAVGGNAQSARLMGLNVERTQILIYSLSGVLSALAGTVYSVYTSSGNATAAMGLELDVIAAVVIGGTLLTGGRGSILGTLIGVLMLGTIQTIITFEATLSSWWARIVIGVLLFLFVILQKGLSVFGNSGWLSPAKVKNVAVFILPLLMGCATSQESSASSAAANAYAKAKAACPAGYESGRELQKGLYQITGNHVKVGQTKHAVDELPDPAPPYVTRKGEVEIYGSARYFIRFPNWAEFEKGGCFEIVQIGIANPNGEPYKQEYTHPWDIRKFRVEQAGKADRELLIGGAMNATKGRPVPVWPDDNINRRLYFFRPSPLKPDEAEPRWLRDPLPIVGTADTGWLGHSYGGNLLQEDGKDGVIDAAAPGRIALFYEKVTDDSGNSPYKTEIIMKLMKNFWMSAGGAREITIFKVDGKYPSTKRTVGGFLAEGPRPMQVRINGKKFFIIGFSSGDFPTDTYTINYLWSRNLTGPYKPVLNADKTDLLDLGQGLKQRFNLSWVGRPSFYQTPDGSYEMLFHGVRKDILPDNDYGHWPKKYQLWEFFRSIFKVDINLKLDKKGEPVVDLAV